MYRFFLMVTLIVACPVATATSDLDNHEKVAAAVGFNAYIYGYPQVALYRRFWEQALDEGRPYTEGVNEFIHDRSLAGPSDRMIPAPNNDTVYSRAWFDLREGPLVLEIPSMAGRFYGFPLGDFFHDIVYTPGSWNTPDHHNRIVMTGPGCDLPAAHGRGKVIQMPTSMGWILGRILTNGSEKDLSIVHKLQDGLKISPYQGQYVCREKTPAADYPTPDPMNSLDFFKLLNHLLRINPPRPADEGLVATFGEIGVHPSQQFDGRNVDPAVRQGLEQAISTGEKFQRERATAMGRNVNNWSWIPLKGQFDTNYFYRATLEYIGLQHADETMQAAYTAFIDKEGQPLNGSKNYRITFNPPPPVDAFWSLTLYGEDYFLVDNPINRYSIGDRTQGLEFNKDDSLTVFIQHESPAGNLASNWLPAPDGNFWISIRAYLPRPSFLDGTWVPPDVVSAEPKEE